MIPGLTITDWIIGLVSLEGLGLRKKRNFFRLVILFVNGKLRDKIVFRKWSIVSLSKYNYNLLEANDRDIDRCFTILWLI